VKGNVSNNRQLIAEPKTIGTYLPILSETLPMNGLNMIKATIWLPIIAPIDMRRLDMRGGFGQSTLVPVPKGIIFFCPVCLNLY